MTDTDTAKYARDSFIVLVNPGEGEGRQQPAWKRTLIVSELTCAVFAPADACPVGEMAAVMMAAYDGNRLMMHEAHAFVLLSWLEREFPRPGHPKLQGTFSATEKDHFVNFRFAILDALATAHITMGWSAATIAEV